MFCSINVRDLIEIFKINPNYLNFLLVAIFEKLLFFIIPEDFQETPIRKPQYVFIANNKIIKFVEFNPINSHSIAFSSHEKLIQIWTVGGTSTQNIRSEKSISKIIWNNCGKLLGFIDGYHVIKIYNCEKKIFIYYLDFGEEVINFEFFMNDRILVLNSTKDIIFIYQFNMDQQGTLFLTKNKGFVTTLHVNYKSILTNNNYLIVSSINNIMQIYNNVYKLIYSHDNSLFNAKIIKASNDKSICKILNVGRMNAQLIIIKDKFNLFNKDDKKDTKIDEFKKTQEDNDNYNYSLDEFYFSHDNLKEDYFKNCPPMYLNIYKCLHYKNNVEENNKKKRKIYFKISDIEKNLEMNKNKNLITLRNEVDKDIKELINKEKKAEGKEKGRGVKEEKLKLFKSIKDEYLFLLNLLT